MVVKDSDFTKQTVQIIKGLLDIKPHPVAIIDTQTKEHLYNDKWSDKFKNLKDLVTQPSERLITVSGQKFKINKQELNHGTKCLMVELIPYDDSINRLKGATNKLDQILQTIGE